MLEALGFDRLRRVVEPEEDVVVGYRLHLDAAAALKVFEAKLTSTSDVAALSLMISTV